MQDLRLNLPAGRQGFKVKENIPEFLRFLHPKSEILNRDLIIQHLSPNSK
jgi:hypothetical protein